MSEAKSEAERLYLMVRSQLKDFHDPKHLHDDVISVCAEFVALDRRRGGDDHFWHDVRMELDKIRQKPPEIGN